MLLEPKNCSNLVVYCQHRSWPGPIYIEYAFWQPDLDHHPVVGLLNLIQSSAFSAVFSRTIPMRHRGGSGDVEMIGDPATWLHGSHSDPNPNTDGLTHDLHPHDDEPEVLSKSARPGKVEYVH